MLKDEIKMSHLTIYPVKIFVGMLAGFLSVFVQNLLPLFVTVTIFEAIDFFTGCVKSYVLSKRKKERFAFESVKAWRTIYKYVFILVGIVLAEMLDRTLGFEARLRFANYFTAFLLRRGILVISGKRGRYFGPSDIPLVAKVYEIQG